MEFSQFGLLLLLLLLLLKYHYRVGKMSLFSCLTLLEANGYADTLCSVRVLVSYRGKRRAAARISRLAAFAA